MREFRRDKKTKFSARDFDRPNIPNERFRRRGGDRFEGPGPREFRGGERREMFDVTCDKCGRECQVPVKPTSSKPVYCSDCFRKNESATEPRGRPSAGASERELEQINQKLDMIIKALGID